MTGSEQVITYEEIAAYQAQQGIAAYAYNSGGTVTGGYWVNWDYETGFTGQGWTGGPVASAEAAWAEIDANGNLNESFANWGADLGIKLEWALAMYNAGCAYEV